MSSPTEMLGLWVCIPVKAGCLSAFILCLCCPVYVEALHQADPLSKESY
jgi:hypothetical protein